MLLARFMTAPTVLLLSLLHLLAALLLFVLHDPVEVAQHVCVRCLETEILLDFDLKDTGKHETIHRH